MARSTRLVILISIKNMYILYGVGNAFFYILFPNTIYPYTLRVTVIIKKVSFGLQKSK